MKWIFAPVISLLMHQRNLVKMSLIAVTVTFAFACRRLAEVAARFRLAGGGYDVPRLTAAE